MGLGAGLWTGPPPAMQPEPGRRLPRCSTCNSAAHGDPARPEQQGEAEVLVVRVDRSSPRHTLIEGTVLRDDVPPAEVAWLGTPGSC